MTTRWLAGVGALVLGSMLTLSCGGSTGGGGGTGGGSGGSGATGGSGGSGATGGSGGGSGGIPLVPSDKLDLLLMIDNSISMADKQQLLSDAVPALVKRLVTPVIDPATGKPQFKAIEDIHIGIVSSSLGGHGGDQCKENGPAFNPTQNDNAHLIGSVRPSANLQTYAGLGFLWWDPSGTKGSAGPGQSDAAQLESDFKAQVTAAGENGCGYESQLESWYRFLVDPAPPAQVVVVDNIAVAQGVDAVVLQQRSDFLRPDSVVIVMMLTDENDCSTVDGGFNWIAAQTSNPNNTAFHLPRAAGACATDPDSPCCRSCNVAESSPPPGCADLGSDPECQKGAYDDQSDHPNLRCWEQKRRFGLDFLYPTERYVQALTQPMICPTWDGKGPTTSCTPVKNPLLEQRSPGAVFLAGIVGVPWQDLATEATLSSPTELSYLTAAELSAKGRWAWLLADDSKDLADDPLMIESNTPRSGTQPATGVALSPPSAKAAAQPANGHEWNTNLADLQYACIFRLNTPKDCGAFSSGGCDCDDVGPGYTANNPLCQDPASSTYSKLQHYGKAFPGTRHLKVLKGIGNQAVVGSICPKVTVGDPANPAYGYNPVVDVLVKSITGALAK